MSKLSEKIKYSGFYHSKFIFNGCKTIDDMIKVCIQQASEFIKYKDSGMILDSEVADGYAIFSIETNDYKLIKKLGENWLEEDEEIFDED